VFNCRQVQEIFAIPPHPDPLWDPPSLLYEGYWGHKVAGGMKLTTDLHLVSRVRVV
jgi:hypothetical protein